MEQHIHTHTQCSIQLIPPLTVKMNSLKAERKAKDVGTGVGVGCQHVKVKYTLVQALRLCTGRTAQRGSRDIALLFHAHGTRRG